MFSFRNQPLWNVDTSNRNRLHMKKLLVAIIISIFSGLASQAQDSLFKEDLIPAARLIDLNFTDSERTMMYPDLKRNLNQYRRMHQLELDNSVPMSLWQSPVLPGMKFNSKQDPILWNIPADISLPKDRNELAFYSVLQLASLIKHKKISSVELTQFFIDRLRKYADTLQCVISFTENIAMEQARLADAEIRQGKYRGPLQGIPYGLKDLFAVKGTKTTWGAAPYKNQEIEVDAFVYTQLKKAGAVLIAKFTLGALAMGDYWYGGRTKNPWNMKYGSSGSSAGSTAATVAGLVPFAIGTETYGSIISPSHTCGATGLRPSFGSVSRTGGMTLSWSLDKIGPICRSAEDAAVVFSAIHGTDYKDGTAVNMPFNYTGKFDPAKIRIAYAANYFSKLDSTYNDWKVLEVFKKMGVKLSAIDFPDSSIYGFDMIGIVIGSESAAAFDEMTRLNMDDQLTRQTASDWPNYFRSARFIPAVEYVNANRHRYILMQKMNEIIRNFDVIICPTWSGQQVAITNLTGHPALCMPTGLDGRSLPTSITFIGKLYSEAVLLAVGKAFQDHTDFENVHPPYFQR
jgi:Asp-tRNA(Asn)/Glu-tRNA(Gln) amidotransferase A subunit family amidase